MKAEELRLGNLVLCNTSIGFVNTIVSVCNLSSDEIVCCYKPTKQFIFCKDALFEPIPLTEEWLFKFGFKKNHQNYTIEAVDYFNSVKKDGEGWIYSYDESDACCYELRSINSIHQLQNLYFALTDEELTFIDLKTKIK
jgi:hypothetical protein